MSKTKTAATVSGMGAIACCVAFTPIWEGMDSVAKRDRIGTGHPITYCNGLTSADGAVKVGQRFTKAECDKALAEALPKYWAKIEPHILVELPDKVAGSLLDAAWNAGPGAVIRSPMLAKMNAGNLRAGCNAFAGWYVRSDGQVRNGLIDRRNGEDHGDKRLSEKGLCLRGVVDGIVTGDPFTHAAQSINARLPAPKPAAELNPTPRDGCTYADQDAGRCTIPAPKHVATNCGPGWAIPCDAPPRKHAAHRPAPKPAPPQPFWYHWIWK